jgi:three-Cys-motif partner protein
MSKPNHSTRQTLAEHSAAKVSVFTYYLGIYLNILGKVPAIRRVHIYDMMCGEGEYADGRQGSALGGLNRVLKYFTDYPAETLQVDYVLNDAGLSDVDKGRLKIDRVRERAEQIPFEPVANGRIKIHYAALSCDEAMAKTIASIQSLHPYQEKALLFIDPWGYKDIHIADLRAALAGGHSEILLFLPSEMMFRFARKAYNEDFPGGAALQRWLTELFPKSLPQFTTVHDFINQFRQHLKTQIEAPYSSRFTLETSDHNTYSLFYFTSNRKGLQSMLEAQWKQDQETGSGHRAERTFTLFTPSELTNYPARLETHLAAAPNRTNQELLEFGLDEGFLPRHTNDVLKGLLAQGRLDITAPDGQLVRKNAFYIDNPDRFIRFSLVS